MKATILIGLVLVGHLACKETVQDRLTFEVVSIKPSPDPIPLISAGIMPRRGKIIDGARVDLAFVTMRSLVAMAYGVSDDAVLGPEWISSLRFDIAAKLPLGATTRDVPEMVRSLLRDRFRLAAHTEKRSKPAYLLEVATGGVKLAKSPVEVIPSASPFPNGTKGRTITYRGGGPGAWWTYSRFKDYMVYDAQSITMAEFARMLMAYVDLPIADKTGLAEPFQISELPVPGGPNFKQDQIRLAQAQSNSGVTQPVAPSGVSLERSLRSIGLKLTRAQAMFDQIIIDGVDKNPSEN